MRSASLAVMKAVISVDNIERSECGLRTSGQPSQNRPLTSLGIPRRKSPTLDVATSAQVLLFVVPFLCLRRRARRGPWMQGKCASTSSGSRKKKVRSLAPNGISQVTASSSAGAHETSSSSCGKASPCPQTDRNARTRSGETLLEVALMPSSVVVRRYIHLPAARADPLRSTPRMEKCCTTAVTPPTMDPDQRKSRRSSIYTERHAPLRDLLSCPTSACFAEGDLSAA